MTTTDLKPASAALLKWFESQDIESSDIPHVLAEVLSDMLLKESKDQIILGLAIDSFRQLMLMAVYIKMKEQVK